MSSLGDTIRSLSNQTYEASKPTVRMFGTVTSTDPLKIQVNEKLVLGSSMMVVTQTVKNYIDWEILKTGDMVIMTRQTGGQKYIIDDVVSSADNGDREGEKEQAFLDLFLKHTHEYIDDNWLAKARKTTKTGKWAKEEGE